MEDVYKILQALYSSASGQDVLASIIHVEGSAYRKAGALMLMKEDGTQVGMLSSSCLEADLSARVKEIWENGKSQTVAYDLRSEDDLLWGQGAGCNGLIHVLLEPINKELRIHLWKLKDYLDNGNRVTIIKRLTSENSVSDYLFVANDQQPFGYWQSEDVSVVKDLIMNIHQSRLKSGVHYCRELSTKLFIHSFYPKPRLLLFGAGQDAIPVVRFAAYAGFRVVVSDWRPEFCNHDHFPDVEEFIIGFPKEALKRLTLSADDSVLIMTHQFQRDKELVQLLKEKNISYLGILGPSSRTKRLFDGQKIPANVHSPAGLPIGADGPEEIAISIVAELIKNHKSSYREQKATL